MTFPGKTSEVIQLLDALVDIYGAYESYLVLNCGAEGPYLIANFVGTPQERHADLNARMRAGAKAVGYLIRWKVSEHIDRFESRPLLNEFKGDPAIEGYLKQALDLLIAKGESRGLWMSPRNN